MSANLINIAILITAIAGLVTALVAFFNVRELKISRIAAVAPRISLANSNFTVECNPAETSGDLMELITNMQTPDIEVMNFGNGPAINIEANWKISDDKLIELLKSFDPHDNYNIGIKKSQFTDADAFKLYQFHFHERQLQDKYKAIYPSLSNETSKITLPAYYFEAFHLYIFLSVHKRSDKKTYFELKPFIDANLILTYSDLAGDRMTEQYRINLSYDHNETNAFKYDHNGIHANKKENVYACRLIVTKC